MKSSNRMGLALPLVGLAACVGAEDGGASGSVLFPAPPTTSAELALRNLDLRIESLDATDQREARVDHLLLRSRMLGSYADLDRAAALGQDDAPARVQAAVASARHEFRDALALLASEGAEPDARLAAELAVGEASKVAQALEGRTDLGGLSLRAGALAELGRFEEADAAFVEALVRYRDVSPFVVADLYFRRGVLWAEQAGRAELGQAMYARGLEVFPMHATMSVHMAELEAEGGDAPGAIARLRSLEARTSEPEVDALLGELLVARGDEAEGQAAIAKAKARYEELLDRHPAAFWDHGSEFFAGPGQDPDRALELARANFENRPTERAELLVLEAAQAAGAEALVCERVAQLRRGEVHRIGLVEFLRDTDCP